MEQGTAISRRTTHNGMPAVIFKASDYYGVMEPSCRRTIMGRFLKSRPQIDTIRSRFSKIFPLKGSVKIGVYDNSNIFLTFTNDEDFNLVLYKRAIELEGFQIWLQKWTPNFKPEEDIPIVPVWVLSPGLPFHMHNWNYGKQIIKEVEKPIKLDKATKTMTRPSMAKARVEIDLLKPLVHNVWVGTEYDNTPLRGFSQKIEYENIPKFFKHCRKLGHSMINCRVLEKIKETEKKEALQKDQQGRNKQQQRNSKQDDSETKLPEEDEITPNRGREMQNKRQINKGKIRGRSEPPRKSYKPTGNIFGVDKPHLTSTIDCETNTEITKIKVKTRHVIRPTVNSCSRKTNLIWLIVTFPLHQKIKSWNMRLLILNMSMKQVIKQNRLLLRII
ncbi:hypothetical protein KY289_026912 [Solanum tuberosum]|nr:hypothetical protein KY289_026912 [Solanum tuberosum]